MINFVIDDASKLRWRLRPDGGFGKPPALVCGHKGTHVYEVTATSAEVWQAVKRSIFPADPSPVLYTGGLVACCMVCDADALGLPVADIKFVTEPEIVVEGQ